MKLAAHSLEAHRNLGATLVSSSRHAGWNAILVDHHRVAPDECEFETRATPDQTIVVQLSGEQWIEKYEHYRWHRAIYQAGTIGLTPPNHVDRLRRLPLHGTRTFEKLNLYLSGLVIADAWNEFRRTAQRSDPPSLDALAYTDPLIRHAALALHRAAWEGAPDLYCSATAYWLAVHLLTRHSGFNVDTAQRHVQAITDRRLARVFEMMSARLAEPITLDMLASEACVSRYHFVRLFREKTGMTPYAALLAIRIETAQTLLCGTDFDLGTVASRCGFSSAQALTKAFTRHCSVSPTRWRARSRGDAI
ncbi:AraC family transcriptional regulator [Paraburkholderia sp. J41]|uniref:AraC family transcriptional regulator n=1 Tax=Paraburkholderia sp. J41 TaxID=2805433 RepID=UPI002AC33E9B|nr:AraC family transcriptional regulator [Paraburkholderia sp. J41]